MYYQISIIILFSIITGLLSYIASSYYADKQSKKMSKLIEEKFKETKKRIKDN